MLKEGFEGDAHVAVFELFAELVPKSLDALTFEPRVQVALLGRSDAQWVVSVHFLALLPEVLGLFNDVSSY